MCKLFLICPECFSELELAEKFGEDSYFLTALGALFEQDRDTYAANLQYLLNTCPISEVHILQSTNCNFINQNFDSGLDKIGLATEKTFASDYRGIVNKPVVSISQFDRKREMAELNLNRQMAFVRNVVDDANSDMTDQRKIGGTIYGKGERLADKEVLQQIEANAPD